MRTNLACGAFTDVSLAFGDVAGLESLPPSAVTRDCSRGIIGTLTAVPGEGELGELAVRVVMGRRLDGRYRR